MTQPLDVIVAEDNLIQRTFLARVIESLGYRPFTAEDGRAALDLVTETGAQILITDYHMPGLDGIELTRRIRQLDLDHYVHIILVTGSANENGVRLEALDAGADDFLGKGRETAGLQARLRVASRLIRHARELAEQHRILKEANDHIHADLVAAANAQHQLLPHLQQDILGVRIASAFVPSAVVSGDMFGCFPLDEDRVGFYAVDVSGHGIHASLLSVAIGHLITPEYFSNAVLHDDDRPPDPAALVHELNQRFSGSENDDYFTMFCGVLNCETGRLDYCQAAYPSPFHMAPDGRIDEVGDGGFPVGMFPDLAYENNTLTFERGGTMVICSDAAHEAENPQHTAFGSERIRETLCPVGPTDTDAVPAAIVAALENWRGGTPLEDDLTVVALTRR